MRFLPFIIVLLVGNLFTACNSCDNKDNDPLPVQRPDVTLSPEQSDMSTTADTEITTDGNQNTDGENQKTQTTKVKSSVTTRAAKKPGTNPNTITDYSAPNGTDAENHDGDPYTKHDTTSMPTGTSIR